MVLVAALGRQMQHIRRIGHIAADPVGDLLAESALHARVVAALVGVAEILQSRVPPVAHRHHHRILVHRELLRLGEVQASLPRIAKPVGPFAGMTILLVPDVLLRPKPSLLAQLENEIEHVRVPLAVGDALFDVEDERAGRLEHAKQLLADRQEPIDIFIDRNAAVGLFALIGVGRRGDDEIAEVVWQIRQHARRIAGEDGVAEVVTSDDRAMNGEEYKDERDDSLRATLTLTAIATGRPIATKSGNAAVARHGHFSDHVPRAFTPAPQLRRENLSSSSHFPLPRHRLQCHQCPDTFLTSSRSGRWPSSMT